MWKEAITHFFSIVQSGVNILQAQWKCVLFDRVTELQQLKLIMCHQCWPASFMVESTVVVVVVALEQKLSAHHFCSDCHLFVTQICSGRTG